MKKKGSQQMGKHVKSFVTEVKKNRALFVMAMPAFLLVSVPYLVKDVLSIIGALVVALVIKKTLSKSGIILNTKTAA